MSSCRWQGHNKTNTSIRRVRCFPNQTQIGVTQAAAGLGSAAHWSMKPWDSCSTTVRRPLTSPCINSSGFLMRSANLHMQHRDCDSRGTRHPPKYARIDTLQLTPPAEATGGKLGYSCVCFMHQSHRQTIRSVSGSGAGHAACSMLTHWKGDILLYTSGACHRVRSSLWKPNGVRVRL